MARRINIDFDWPTGAELDLADIHHLLVAAGVNADDHDEVAAWVDTASNWPLFADIAAARWSDRALSDFSLINPPELSGWESA